MRRWFVGVAVPSADGATLPSPAGGQRLWEGLCPFWVVGDWAEDNLRQWARGERRVVVLGVLLGTDVELWQAAERWLLRGEHRALLELPGSYNVVVQDRNGVRAFTDLAGQRPIFSTTWCRGVVFGSLAQPLAALTTAGCDRARLGATLLCPDLTDLTLAGSPFIGVSRVPPGGSLVAGSDSASCKPPPCSRPTTTLVDAATALRAALSRAVHRRIHRSQYPSADLSGGLDSSTITLLATQALSADARLPCFTYVDDITGEDDLRHATIVAGSHREHLDHIVLRGNAGTLPYAAIHEAPLTDEPTADVVIFSRLRFRLEACRAAGSELHLTGQGGDAVLSAPISYLADLFRQRRWRRLMRDSFAWARVRSGSPVELLGAAARLGRTSRADAMRSVAETLVAEPDGQDRRGSIADAVSWFATPTTTTSFTPELRREVADRLREAAESQLPAESSGGRLPGDAMSLTDVQLYGAGNRMTEQVCDSLHCELASPYLDDQVVAACLSCAATERVNPFVPKPLLVEAFPRLLPAQIISRRTKGDYSPAEYAGVREHAADLVALVNGPALESMEILVPGALRRTIEWAADGFPSPFGTLNDIVAAEVWLRKLQCAPWRWWQIQDGAACP